jgi:hypothetical protein
MFAPLRAENAGCVNLNAASARAGTRPRPRHGGAN